MALDSQMARVLVPGLLLTALGSLPALAGDPPAATYPFQYHFSSPSIGVISDIAAYAPDDSGSWVFVVDRAVPHEMLRFTSTGASNHVSATLPRAPSVGNQGCLAYWDVGLAVNDNPGSWNFGYLF